MNYEFAVIGSDGRNVVDLSWSAFITHSIFAAAGAAGAWAVQVLREKHADRAFRRLYHLPLPSRSAVKIICPSQPSDLGRNVPTTFEDSAAQALVQAALLRRRVEAGLMLHTAVSDLDKRDNLFLVCGPAGNTVTQSVLETVKLPFLFAQIAGSWKIVDRDGNVAHPDPSAPHTDYGIAATLNNPWSLEERRIWLAAGIRGLGTLGAARLMTERINLLRAHAGSRLNESFAALIEAKHAEPGPPEVAVLRLLHL